jgi:hypothetical protein
MRYDVHHPIRVLKALLPLSFLQDVCETKDNYQQYDKDSQHNDQPYGLIQLM